jgi:hypothetical protein
LDGCSQAAILEIPSKKPRAVVGKVLQIVAVILDVRPNLREQLDHWFLALKPGVVEVVLVYHI